MTEERKFTILFAATILAARTLIETKPTNPTWRRATAARDRGCRENRPPPSAGAHRARDCRRVGIQPQPCPRLAAAARRSDPKAIVMATLSDHPALRKLLQMAIDLGEKIKRGELNRYVDLGESAEKPASESVRDSAQRELPSKRPDPPRPIQYMTQSIL